MADDAHPLTAEERAALPELPRSQSNLLPPEEEAALTGATVEVVVEPAPLIVAIERLERVVRVLAFVTGALCAAIAVALLAALLR